MPDGFLWGAATAAHQVEGNNVNSDCWAAEHDSSSRFRCPSGDAADHYHRYRGDIGLMAELGWNAYRFGLEWARIEPEAGHFSRAVLDHYRRVASACHDHGITTVVTLNHWTLPRWFAEQDGWLATAAMDRWERYVDRVVTHLGADMDWVCTLNEPNVVAVVDSGGGAVAGPDEAPPVGGGGIHALSAWPSDRLSVFAEAHRRARDIIGAGNGSALVGWTLAVEDLQAAPGGEAALAAGRAMMQDGWLDQCAGDDFVGVQNYTRGVFGPDGRRDPPPKVSRHDVGWELYPPSLANACTYAAQRSGVPVLVTEHGVATFDDELQLRHTQASLSELAGAIEAGVDVRGYLAWSALDEFEWFMGYDVTFGLIAVDRSTFARTPKPTARWLGRCARAGALTG